MKQDSKPTQTVTATDETVEELLQPDAPDELVRGPAPLPPQFDEPTDDGLPAIFHLANMLWNSARSFLPKNLQSPAEVVAIILTGREMGLGHMSSLRSLYIVDGKVSMPSELMLARALMAGVRHKWVETTDKKAVLKLTRDGHEPHTETFTIEDAKAAGLVGKMNWKKYPKAMLRHRTVSAAVTAFCPDVLFGVYVPDELDGMTAAPAQWEHVSTSPAGDFDEVSPGDAGPTTVPKTSNPTKSDDLL